jgi:preprotein translocase subunit SecG
MSSRTKKRLIQRAVVISIFVVAFIVFLFFLKYLTTERNPEPTGSISVRVPDLDV